jgi:hypothetical protein
LAKPVSIVIPFLLLVIDWYPLKRLTRKTLVPRIKEKFPYLLLSASTALIAILAGSRSSGTIVSLVDLPLSARLVISGSAVYEYVRLTLFPFGIIPYYPMPAAPIPLAYTIKTVLAALCGIAAVTFGRKSPAVTATTLSFILPLLPVLSFLQNGDQSMATRYTYLPSVGISVFAAAGIYTVMQCTARWSRVVRAALIIFLFSLTLWYALLTQRLIDVWKNTETLWTRIIELHQYGKGYKERGLYYLTNERYQEGIADITTAITMATRAGNPERYNLFAFRGEGYGNLGAYELAVQDFTSAIAMSPRKVYFYHRGLAYKAWGKDREAAADFLTAGDERGPIYWYELSAK